MEYTENQNPESMPASAQKPSKHRGIVIGLAAVTVLALAAAGGAYFWQQQRVDNLNKTNATLTSQLAAAQKTTPSTSTPTSDAVTYKSSVGKFTLNLPSGYAVVREIDGMSEGSPYVSLGIGRTTSTTGVVDFVETQYPTVVARPIRASETFRSIVDADLKDKSDPVKTSVMVGGVDAESYTYGGFSVPRSVYFTKNGIYYRLQTNDKNSDLGKLEPIITGFMLN